MRDVNNRIAFITGGASGIGFGIAQALLENGSRVVIADRDQAALDRAGATLEGDRTRFFPIQLDVTDRAGWTAAAKRVEQEIGPVDILCNNAGISPESRPLTDISPEGWDRFLAIKLTGTYNGIRTFVPGMKARKTGHIINTSSVAGLIAAANCAEYTSCMFGLVGLSETLRAELAPYGVGVSVLCPGNTKSNLVANARERVVAGMGEAAAGALEEFINSGMEPIMVGRRVVRAILDNDLHILTHPEYRELVELRFACIRRAFGESADPSYHEREEAIQGMLSQNPYGAGKA